LCLRVPGFAWIAPRPIARPLERLPELLTRLEAYSGRSLTRIAVELTLLVFIRSSELRFARWDEFDTMRAQ
jgi:integrase